MKKIFLGLLGSLMFFVVGCVNQPKSFTLQEVATHATGSDCWLVIHDKVYNVTNYIPRHPGGPVIIQSCGKDATSLFESRPEEGTSHSDRARQMLETLYVGELRK